MTESAFGLSPPLVALSIFVLMVAALAYERRLDFLARELPPGPARAVGPVLLVLVVVFSVFLPVALPPPDVIDVSRIGFPDLFVGHAVLFVFLIVWWQLAGRRDASEFLLLQSPTRDDLRAGVALGVLAWTGTLTTTLLVGSLFLFQAEALDADGPPRVILWMARLPVWQKLVTIFVAMTVEEMFFRGFLQARIGLAPSTILFTLAHAGYGMPLLLVGICTFSIIVGLFFERSGRLLPCILAHGVFDAVQLLVLLPYAADVLEKQLG